MNKKIENICIVCGGSNFYLNALNSKIIGLKPPYSVLSCSSCGFHLLTPELDNDTLEKIYGEGYFNSKNDETANSLDLYNEGLKAIPSYSETVQNRYSIFLNTLKNIKKLNPDGIDFLDVGAATGEMVITANEFGFKAVGTEFSNFAITIAREKNKIELKKVELNYFSNNLFDFIHLSHVFEHFTQPKKELIEIKRILKQDGILYLEIPFQFNFIEKMLFFLNLRKSNFDLHSLHHPFFYNPKNFKKLLLDSGFKILHFSVFQSNRYPRNSLQRYFKFIFWYFLSLFKIGNYMIVYAKISTRKYE